MSAGMTVTNTGILAIASKVVAEGSRDAVGRGRRQSLRAPEDKLRRVERLYRSAVPFETLEVSKGGAVMHRTTVLMITALTVGGLVSCSEDEQTSSTTQDQATVAVEDETTAIADATEEGSTPMAVDDGDMEVVDSAGVRYAVLVTPEDPNPEESVGGCIPAADAGKTNIRFGLLVGHTATSAAYRGTVAVPHMEFRLNLNDNGRSVDPQATTFDSARYTDIEARSDGQCDEMNSIGPDGVPSDVTILVGEILAFPLTAGPTSDPPPEGVVLYVRFFDSADGDVSDLAVRYDP